jgi:sigma-B regulation protein RsbU (phosphoserine phosphatase)
VLGLAVAYLAGEFALFRLLGLLADGAYPAASSLGVFGTMLGAQLRVAQLALAREREAKARLEGELSAARAIQMGLLPHRFPPFPEHEEIDIHAFIEPARTIGGDLYDFAMIDRTRLFFAVADVSGKGIPAALFMAMTKEVLRAAVVRHGAALDDAMAEANAKVAAASADMSDEGADMMFVTVFAGVLDLDTGDCRYVSAGHDSPFLLRHGKPPEQIPAQGGPPLGAVDEFDFPIDRCVLQRGEALLLFTDGVTEAQDAARTLYSVPRLSRALAAAPLGSAHATVEHLRADLTRFVLSAEQADDITILALRWLG